MAGKIYSHEYYIKNKARFAEASRKYREKKKREAMKAKWNPRLFDMREDYKTPTIQTFKDLPKQELTYAQKYYAENREKIREQQRLGREKKKRREKQRAYYAKNREKILEQQKSYRRSMRQAYIQSQQPTGFIDRIVARFRNLFGG